MMKVLLPSLLPVLLLAPMNVRAAPASSPSSGAGKIVLDAVVASVDGKPITLQDLAKRVKRKVSFREISSDPGAQRALDELITERIILEESESKRYHVADEELEAYIDEVAQRNGMTRPQFLEALAAEGRSLDEYRHQIRIEILKTRLLSSQMRTSVAVTDQEVDEYLKDHAERSSVGAKVELRQILVSSQNRNWDQIKARLKEIVLKLDAGEDFDDLAEKYSDSSEGKRGGSLGELSVKDLNPAIFDAILSLEEEEISRPVQTPAGIHLFQLVKRIAAESDKEIEATPEKREEARKLLERQKMEQKLTRFFTDELQKHHAVDRKI
jgi:peptidyl-prolyl cis-trans isomerase SurA